MAQLNHYLEGEKTHTTKHKKKPQASLKVTIHTHTHKQRSNSSEKIGAHPFPNKVHHLKPPAQVPKQRLATSPAHTSAEEVK